MEPISSTAQRGHVRRGLPRSLDKRDPVSIGSRPSSDIVIDGAKPHHAELRWDAKEETWGLYYDTAQTATCVSSEEIQLKRLFGGDSFDIAGVRIGYADGMLKEIKTDRPVGLCVCVRNVSATAGGKQRLDNVSFKAENGSFVALLGPSGCGKSTLIQRIAGLAPFEGEILFNGHSISSEKSDLQPLVAYLPQSVEDSLNADMTIEEAMEDFARCHLAKGECPNFAAKLGDVELDYDKLKVTPVRQLSGGMKRRFALALALMRNPQLLLLDEPTAGLDPAAESSIMELLRRIANQGRTVLCATHVLSCLDMCDKVAVLAPGGRLVFFGQPPDAFAHFNCSDWLSVYRTLVDGTFEPDSKFSDTPCPQPCYCKMPDASPTAMFGRYFCATFKRLWRTVRSIRNAFLFFGNPIAVALVLTWACGDMFGKKGPWETVCFCMAVAMFWLGLSGSVRSLVSERVPKRCLDRMRGVPLIRYFSSHVAFVAFSAVVQSVLFIVPVFILRQDATYFSLWALPIFWLVMALTCFAGGCVGLAVSAGAKNEIQAVWVLPFVAILALFLSKPVLKTGEYEEDPDGKQNSTLVVASWVMPTIHAQEYLGAELEKHRIPNKEPENYTWKFLKFLFVPGIAYPLLFLPLAFILQKRREEKWDGR